MSRNVLGVDEAGRGAVIGPLVISGVLFPRGDLIDILTSSGIKDSKLLTALKREELYKLIQKLSLKMIVFKIAPAKINKESLNHLEAFYTAKIINKLSPHLAYLDVPASGRGIENYCQKVRGSCQEKSVKILGGNHLDTTNVLVAAASIVAKEHREREVRKLHQKFGDFGSGYPADPKTRQWLKTWSLKNGEWPKIVRTKWSTLTSL